MAEVAVCPRCEGEKKVHNARSGRQEDCPTCEGKGVVWRNEEAAAAEQSEPVGADDPRDLTFRR